MVFETGSLSQLGTIIRDFSPIITSIITTVSTLLIALFGPKLKDIFDKRLMLSKLELEYQYDQKKKIREILAKNKIQLLNCCENMNHRLWNLATNFREGWQFSNTSLKESAYYLKSFVYRLVVVFAWIRKIEKEMIYLDSTIATKRDIEFICFLRVIPQVLCDVRLFEGFEYRRGIQGDHFFKHNLEKAADILNINGAICDYKEFDENIDKFVDSLDGVVDFLNGINPDEERFRWDILQLFHLTIIAFINSYGYEFQYTLSAKVEEISQFPRYNRLVKNYVELLRVYNLTNQVEIEKILRVIKGTCESGNSSMSNKSSIQH